MSSRVSDQRSESISISLLPEALSLGKLRDGLTLAGITTRSEWDESGKMEGFSHNESISRYSWQVHLLFEGISHSSCECRMNQRKQG